MAPLGAPKLALWAVLAAAAALVGPSGAISPEVEAELTELCELNPRDEFLGSAWFDVPALQPCQANTLCAAILTCLFLYA
jgi:hypothetical protein